MAMQFDYYYGIEAEQFIFFQQEEAEGILEEDSIHWREVNDPSTEYCKDSKIILHKNVKTKCE